MIFRFHPDVHEEIQSKLFFEELIIEKEDSDIFF